MEYFTETCHTSSYYACSCSISWFQVHSGLQPPSLVFDAMGFYTHESYTFSGKVYIFQPGSYIQRSWYHNMLVLSCDICFVYIFSHLCSSYHHINRPHHNSASHAYKSSKLLGNISIRAWKFFTILELASFKSQFQTFHVLQCLLKMQIIPMKSQFQTYSKCKCALYTSDFEKHHL